MAPGGDRLQKLSSIGEFAAMHMESGVSAAGSHKWLPYSKEWAHSKSTDAAEWKANRKRGACSIWEGLRVFYQLGSSWGFSGRVRKISRVMARYSDRSVVLRRRLPSFSLPSKRHRR